ncbi:MAG: hypothetical protein V1871_00725 [Planctomycetota bacterium]
MPSLKRYKTFLLDANCIVYYCFNLTETSASGQVIILKCMDHTGKISFTNKSIEMFDFVRNNSRRKIITIQMIYEEVPDALSRELKKQITYQDLRNQLGLPRGEPFPEDLELKLIEKMNANFLAFENHDWFTSDIFEADRNDINQVKRFYIQLESDGSKQGLLKTEQPLPGEKDINLIIFSRIKSFPLISNDKHIYGPRIELKRDKLVYEIIPLMDISIN